jgi:MoxR-like ATPase
VRLVHLTREDARLSLGASPRAGLTLLRSAKAMALLGGRGHVEPEDIKGLAPMVLEHRLLVTPEARARGASAADVVADALARAPVPFA